MRKHYIKPLIATVACPDNIMASFDTGSIGSLASDRPTNEKFHSMESFSIVEDKQYQTSDEQKFWDDWDNGAD